MIKLFKALSDETRVDIMKHLHNNGLELSCQAILDKFPLSQPTLSHHINKLIDANVLLVRKEGTNHFYSLNRQFLQDCGLNINKIAR